MDLFLFLLIVISAVFHAYWNLLSKTSEDKFAFVVIMNFTSLLTTIPVFYFILPNWILPLPALFYLLLSGLVGTVYFYSLMVAYDSGDLSVVYPLARSSPMFVFLLAMFFLGEMIPLSGVLGILLVVMGVYVIHLNKISKREILNPVRSLRSRASQYALLAALCTAIYSLIDKVGVSIINPVLYAFWFDVFLGFFLIPVVFYKCKLRGIRKEWKKSGIKAIIAGFFNRLGYLLILVVMGLVPVSYVVSIRQSSVIIGTIFGVILLREKHGKIRLLGSAIIFSGICILGLLA